MAVAPGLAERARGGRTLARRSVTAILGAHLRAGTAVSLVCLSVVYSCAAFAGGSAHPHQAEVCSQGRTLLGKPPPGQVGSRAREGVRRLRRAASTSAEAGYDYEAWPWFLDISVSNEELAAVVTALPADSSFWPDPNKYLSREDFRTFIKGRSSGLRDAAIDSVFNAFNGASSFIDFGKREEVFQAVKSWRPQGGSSAPNLGGLQLNIFTSRLTVLGAYLFLNVFSAFAGYFVIGRPILYQLTGIDLLPNLVRFWEAS